MRLFSQRGQGKAHCIVDTDGGPAAA